MKRGAWRFFVAFTLLIILSLPIVLAEETVTQETTKAGKHDHSKFFIRRFDAVSAKPYSVEECVDFVPKGSYVYATCDAEVGKHTHQVLYNGRWYTTSPAGSHNHEKFFRSVVTTQVGSGGQTGLVGISCVDQLHSGETNYGTCDTDKHTHFIVVDGQKYYTNPAPLYTHNNFYTLGESKGCIFGVSSGQETYGSCDKQGEHTHTVTLPAPKKEVAPPSEQPPAEDNEIVGEEPQQEEEAVPAPVEKKSVPSVRLISELVVVFVLGVVIGALIFLRKKR